MLAFTQQCASCAGPQQACNAPLMNEVLYFDNMISQVLGLDPSLRAADHGNGRQRSLYSLDWSDGKHAFD